MRFLIIIGLLLGSTALAEWEQVEKRWEMSMEVSDKGIYCDGSKLVINMAEAEDRGIYDMPPSYEKYQLTHNLGSTQACYQKVMQIWNNISRLDIEYIRSWEEEYYRDYENCRRPELDRCSSLSKRYRNRQLYGMALGLRFQSTELNL